MSWSSERRTAYSGIFLLVVLLVLGLFAYRFFYDAPTCVDGTQNGGEEGIDCGGSCEAVCRFNAAQPGVLWARFFEVSPGVYNAVALLENPNLTAQAEHVSYAFQLRDDRNILIVEKEGTTHIPPQRTVPIFEAGVRTGGRTPSRITFELQNVENWVIVPEAPKDVRIADQKLIEGAEPRLGATVRNENLETLEDIEFVAVLSDAEGNAVAASRTVLTDIPGGSDTPIVFTWPAPFSAKVAVIEIIQKLPFVENR